MNLPTPHAPLDPGAVGRSLFAQSDQPSLPTVPGFTSLEYLASGGFGHVWQATPEKGGSPVALKIPHRLDDETSERLESEAASLQALNHPNIVRLLDITATAGGLPVLVMELVNGPPITARLPREGFPFANALRIFLPVLDAVSHAHAAGIVHRDLKPGNILLGSDGTPKVTDFGLAQSLEHRLVNFTLTMSGAVAGTIEYLAPERYEPGTKAGTAADIYALGIILYELLTGIPPRGAWQPPSQIRRLDIRLDALILEAIHADPAQRLPSAEVFKKRLEEIRDSPPRFSGTPLVTRPVRITDCAWTIAGLYFLACAYCSPEKMNNTRVPAIFDLTFGHTKLLGGYWALWTLSLGMGLVWIWQTIRLRRFRHIPLREALPSPFGLRLGHSRGAAWLVGIIHVLCGWLPLLYMGLIFSQCWFWAAPDTAPWEHVLAITRWGSEEPVSPWTFDARGMVSGDVFWIREIQPGTPSSGTILLDRQSFFAVTQPLLMTLGLTGIGTGIIALFLFLAGAWRQRRRGGLILALLGCGSVFAATAFARRMEINDKPDPASGPQRMKNAEESRLEPLLSRWFSEVTVSPAQLPQDFILALGQSVETAPGLYLDRERFIAALAERPPITRHLEAARLQPLEEVRAEAFRVALCARLFEDAGDSSSGCFLKTSIHCLRRLPDSPEIILGWSEEKVPLYQAAAHSLSPGEAASWMEQFLASLYSADDTSALPFCLPVMLGHDPNASGPGCPVEHRLTTFPRETIVRELRQAMKARSDIHLKLEGTPQIRDLPGARKEVRFSIHHSGTSHSRSLLWTVELVFTGGRWQALILRQ